MIIIDATDLLVGRMATQAAKLALKGEEVNIVNCDKAIYSGSEQKVLESFKQARDRRVPLQGPYFPRQSDRIVRRSIRGMLPYKTPKGRKAFEAIKCFVNVPESLQGKSITFKEANRSKLPNEKFVTVARVSKFLGGKR